MIAQPPLALIPAGAVEVGAAAAIIEDADGGRVYVHGNLAFAWDAGDIATRRFAAVQLMRIKVATQVQIAAAFGTAPLTIWRWEQSLSEVGVSGLSPQRKGPRGATKLTCEVVATITDLRKRGLSLRTIGDRVGVSEASVRRALSGNDTDEHGAATVSDAPTAPAPAPGVGNWQVPVLADPGDRTGERVLAAFGMITSAPPVFTGCARAPLAGLLLAVPALSATGLLRGRHC